MSAGPRTVIGMHMRLNDGSPSVLDRLARAADAVYDLVEDGRLWRVPDRDVLAGVDAAYALVTQAQAAALTILGELDARALATEAGASSTQAWLAGRRRLGQTDAKRDVTLAQMLHRAGQKLAEADLNRPGDHAQVEGVVLRDALVTGQVSLAQAQAIATALDELPADITVAGRVQAERLLLAEADQHGPAALARLGHRISERLDPDGADKLIGAQLEREEREAQRLRSGTRFADGHGSVWYRFKVPVADDAFIHPILDTLAAPEPAGQAVDGYDIRSPQQRLADAFVETFRRVGLDGGLPTKGGDRPRVLITMDFEKLKRGTGYATMLDTGDQLSVEAVRRLACDAHVIPAVLGGHGQILDLGRARRTAAAGGGDRPRPGLHPSRLYPSSPLVRCAPCHPLVGRRPHQPAQLRPVVRVPPQAVRQSPVGHQFRPRRSARGHPATLARQRTPAHPPRTLPRTRRNLSVRRSETSLATARACDISAYAGRSVVEEIGRHDAEWVRPTCLEHLVSYHASDFDVPPVVQLPGGEGHLIGVDDPVRRTARLFVAGLLQIEVEQASAG